MVGIHPCICLPCTPSRVHLHPGACRIVYTVRGHRRARTRDGLLGSNLRLIRPLGALAGIKLINVSGRVCRRACARARAHVRKVERLDSARSSRAQTQGNTVGCAEGGRPAGRPQSLTILVSLAGILTILVSFTEVSVKKPELKAQGRAFPSFRGNPE